MPLERCFTVADAGRRGVIGSVELQSALQATGLPRISRTLASSLVRMHDASGRAHLSYPEFEACHAFLQRTNAIFMKHDPQRAGSINLQAVQLALLELGFSLDMNPSGAFYKVCESFDASRQGVIDQESFVTMAVQLTNSKRMFELFDEAKAGRVTLDFNQLVWINAQL